MLAARIAVSNLQNTLDSFSETAKLLNAYVHPKTGERSALIADDVFAVIMEHADTLNTAVPDRDFF